MWRNSEVMVEVSDGDQNRTGTDECSTTTRAGLEKGQGTPGMDGWGDGCTMTKGKREPWSNMDKSTHFTHQHAVITMFVQKQHAGLEADGNFLLGIASVAGEEDGFAADAVICEILLVPDGFPAKR